ncbi:hypothetical protein GCM10023085_29990 [Actinomadura viridis]|uniref:Uncharacterized protein n=1 Tax=Actinomadura viridis TaxID=58110 RepID=A0A931DDM8_9ACTN|nr:hypothetical protein [Actinomadura viridis]
MFVMLALITLAVLVPLLGADSRDGLDWAPGHFWRRRLSSARIRKPGSPARAGEGRGAADHRRSVPAAG